MKYRLIMFCLLLHISFAHAMEVEVRALFDGAALLVIDGESELLKAGSTSEQGLELIQANSKQAIVRINGNLQALSLSERISSSFEVAQKSQVQIAMDQNRQYLTAGVINGRPVRLLVDTGANVVALNESMARSLGIALDEAIAVKASTASEDASALMVTIKEIQVGAISRNNVQAVIILGDGPKDILLGMTFLQHVEITEKSGLMTLTAKY